MTNTTEKSKAQREAQANEAQARDLVRLVKENYDPSYRHEALDTMWYTGDISAEVHSLAVRILQTEK